MSKMDEFIEDKQKKIDKLYRVKSNPSVYERRVAFDRAFFDMFRGSSIPQDFHAAAYYIYYNEMCARFLEANGFTKEADTVRTATKQEYSNNIYGVYDEFVSSLLSSSEVVSKPFTEDDFIYAVMFLNHDANPSIVTKYLGKESVDRLTGLTQSINEMKYEIESVRDIVKAIELSKKIDSLTDEEAKEALITVRNKALEEKKEEYTKQIEELTKSEEFSKEAKISSLRAEIEKIDKKIEENKDVPTDCKQILKDELRISGYFNEIDQYNARRELDEQGVSYEGITSYEARDTIRKLERLAQVVRAVDGFQDHIDADQKEIEEIDVDPNIKAAISSGDEVVLLEAQISNLERRKTDLEAKKEIIEAFLNENSALSMAFKSKSAKQVMLAELARSINKGLSNREDVEKALEEINASLESPELTTEIGEKKQQKEEATARFNEAVDSLAASDKNADLSPSKDYNQSASVTVRLVALKTSISDRKKMLESDIQRNTINANNARNERSAIIVSIRDHTDIVDYNGIRVEPGMTAEETIAKEIEKQETIKTAVGNEFFDSREGFYGTALSIAQEDGLMQGKEASPDAPVMDDEQFGQIIEEAASKRMI